MENKKWDFGFMQPEILSDGTTIRWKHTGGGSGSYPLSAVNGVQYEAGFLTAHFIILSSGGDNKSVPVPKSDKSKKLVEDVNAYIASHKKKNQPAPSGAAFSVADELVKLAALRDAGVLTAEEFTQQKQRLLSA